MAVLHPCLHCWGGGHHDHTLLGSPWEHPFSCRLVLIRWLWDVMKLIVTLWETNSGLCKVFWTWYLLDMLEASCTTTTRWSFWETLWQRNYVEIISPPSVLRGEIFNFWLGCRRLSVQRRKAWQALSQNWEPSNPMVYHHFIIFLSRDSFWWILRQTFAWPATRCDQGASVSRHSAPGGWFTSGYDWMVLSESFQETKVFHSKYRGYCRLSGRIIESQDIKRRGWRWHGKCDSNHAAYG